MSRLPTVKPQDVVKALKRAGFEEHHQRGSHLYLWHQEKRLMTSVPRHPGDLARGTLRAILRQAALSSEEFISLL